MKRYTDEERPNACCYDCGLEYGGDAWMDALVPNDVWAIINPTFHEGAGILCVSCINRRCVEAGLSNVPVWIASGALTSKDYDTLTPDVLKARHGYERTDDNRSGRYRSHDWHGHKD